MRVLVAVPDGAFWEELHRVASEHAISFFVNPNGGCTLEDGREAYPVTLLGQKRA